MLVPGLGIGALASQLGAVTVSAVLDRQSVEVADSRTPRGLEALATARRA
jgi:hypothetical protein